MNIFKRITAVMLSTAMLAGTAYAAAVQQDGDISGISAAAANTSSAPKLNKGVISLGNGESFKLSADQSVKWRTSDSKVVTVDGSGNVKAAGTGTAWVTAKNNSGLESSCRITVKSAPSKVTISKGALTLGVGETYTLSASVPGGSAAAKRTFRTSNSSVVKMTNTNWTGSFKAVKPGTAYVTVRTYNGKEASCKVTVSRDWRTLYTEQLNKCMNMAGFRYRSNESDMQKPMFQLYDADKNGTPELFVSSNSVHAGYCLMYEIVDGKVKQVDVASEYGIISYHKTKKYLGYFGGGMGYYPTTIYKYQNNSLTKLFNGISQQRSYSSPVEYYLWGDRVSESTYNSKLAPYSYDSMNWISLGRQYYLTSSSVSRYVTGA